MTLNGIIIIIIIAMIHYYTFSEAGEEILYSTSTTYLSDNFAKAVTKHMNESFIGLTVLSYILLQ